MFNLDNVVYPGSLLKKVVSFDPTAWGKITAHADRLFAEQQKARSIEIIPNKALVPNPFTLLKNFMARSYNAAIEGQTEPYLQPSSAFHGYSPMYAASEASEQAKENPQIMTHNMVRGLLVYVERNRDRLMEGAGITRQDIHELRNLAGWENKTFGPALVKGI